MEEQGCSTQSRGALCSCRALLLVSVTQGLVWRCLALRECTGRDTHLGPAERWQCQGVPGQGARCSDKCTTAVPTEAQKSHVLPANRMWGWDRAKMATLYCRQSQHMPQRASIPLVMPLWPSSPSSSHSVLLEVLWATSGHKAVP